jgi:hypothetical protein
MSQPTFRDDLALSFSTWRAVPAMPLLTVALAAASSSVVFFRNDRAATAGLSLLLLPLALFDIGYRGTLRVWYARAWQRVEMPLGEVWLMSWRLLGRMLLLGLLTIGPTIVALAPFFALSYAAGLSIRTSYFIGVAISSFLLDVCLTFIVPAIVFSTNSPTRACGIGLRMLRTHWRHALPYFLAPPLALVAVSQLDVPRLTGPAVVFAVQTAAALLDLWFKGAITAYYLRNTPPPPPPSAYGPPAPPSWSTQQPGAPDQPTPPTWATDGSGIPLGSDNPAGYHGRHR